MTKKTKQGKNAFTALPVAPWIYLNDPLDHDVIGSALAALIPKFSIITQATSSGVEAVTAHITHPEFADVVFIIADSKADAHVAVKQGLANQYREAAIINACNFVSINISYGSVGKQATGWGANHLEVYAGGLTAQEIAEKIYKWLFKVLSVPETLHLIHEQEMLATDTKSFPDYEYCSIADSNNRPKDAKIQFVALITSKPKIGENKRLQWTVADRTGVGNFHFQYRGPESKYTWDWVLKLEVGQRHALPRMPFVKVKEEKRVAVVKAPLRAVGWFIKGNGHLIKGIGRGLCTIGNKVKMGSAAEWVPEADVVNGKKISPNAAPVRRNGKSEIQVYNEQGEKVWKDDVDADASTTAGSVYEETLAKEVL